jgi:hypothetical protein
MEDLTSVRGYFCSAVTKTEPIAPIILAVNNISLVELEEFSLSLKDFDFAPNAPTFDQVYSHLITHTVLIASGKDKPLIDPLFDWIMDSRCTSHICNNKSLFTELRPIQSAITTAETPAKVTGVGTAKIQVELDDQIINFSLLNTLLVPSLPVNLISQSKLEPNYYFTTLHGYQARSRDTYELVLEARLIEGLYVVNQERHFETALSVKESLVIWHERLRHISIKRLQTMRDGKAMGVKFFDKEVSDFECDACTLGKIHRQPICNKPCPRLTVSGETTHWDTCGSMPTSLKGSTWLVLGIDDTTRIIFTGTYKSKTDVHQKIKDVVNLINNSRGAHTVKSVHSDNGGKFLGGGIQKWLTRLGIKHTTSAAYTPKHNEVAERALQTIVSMARCLLIASGLPLRFWAEAVYMAVIVYNIVPGAANDHIAPQYVWDKSIPDVSRLRTFKCKVLVKDPTKKLGKFIIRTWDGIYLGSTDGEVK